jgi:hypothetical protein
MREVQGVDAKRCTEFDNRFGFNMLDYPHVQSRQFHRTHGSLRDVRDLTWYVGRPRAKVVDRQLTLILKQLITKFFNRLNALKDVLVFNDAGVEVEQKRRVQGMFIYSIKPIVEVSLRLEKFIGH